VSTGVWQRKDRTDLTLPEVADRCAIRDLVDAYAQCADRRDVPGQMALFTEDVDFIVYADRGAPMPLQKLRGRAALAPMCHQFDAYQAVTHINGQSTTRIDGAHASGVTFCLVCRVQTAGVARTVMTTAVRYLDSYVKRHDTWLIRQRLVLIDWTDTRTLAPG
jgi:hypothetical protein